MKVSKSVKESTSRDHAMLVASGIFLSRIAGLIRERAFAHFFGNSDAGDAFKAALKIPNFLQNLFGEGVLSASFIPVYAKLLGEKNEKDSKQVAETIGSVLFLLVSFLVLAGVYATPYLIDLIAPGFEGDKRLLTIRIVQILFPGTGLLVMSAWCLGILNSHHKFFLAYAAPVLWNLAIIAALYYGRMRSQSDLAVIAAYGLVIGSALQFFIQVPFTLRLLRGFWPNLKLRATHARTVVKNFFPVLVSRGVVQISAYIDSVIASYLPMGAVSALAYAQTIYLLPVSLFGMAVSAAELPAMSKATGTDSEIAVKLKAQLQGGLRRIAFFIVPSVVAFLALGDLIVAILYQSGKFSHADTIYVWIVLAGSTIGLLAATFGRLYSSAFYALRDTKTPFRFAVIRVTLTVGLGYLAALKLPEYLGVSAQWGTVGLTASAGFAGWVEFLLLRSALSKKIGSKTGIEVLYLVKLWGMALGAAILPFALHFYYPQFHSLTTSILLIAIFGVMYLALAKALKIPEMNRFLRRKG